MMTIKIKSVPLVVALIAVGMTSSGLTNSNGNFFEPLSITSAQAQTISPKEHAEEVIQTLADLYPSDQLPTFVLTAETPNYVTAATTGSLDQANFRILYFAEDEPISIDEEQLNDFSPIAAYEKKTYATEEEAIEAVNQILDLQGEAIDLGYDLTGYLQGAAGSTYLNSQEGHWSLVVRANNTEGEDPVPLAQEVVAYLEQVYLPAPETVGQITLKTSPSDSYEANTVIWQDGTVVYQLKHFDAMQVIKMTGSISEPTDQ